MRQQLEFGKRKGGLQTYRLKSLPIGLGVYNPCCAGLNLHRIHFLTSSAFCPFRTYFLDIEFTSNSLYIKNIKETNLFYSSTMKIPLCQIILISPAFNLLLGFLYTCLTNRTTMQSSLTLALQKMGQRETSLMFLLA